MASNYAVTDQSLNPFKLYYLPQSAYEELLRGGQIGNHVLDNTALYLTELDGDQGADTKVSTSADTTTQVLYVTGCTGNTTGSLKYNPNIYINCQTGVLYGAAWNDYAEYRKAESLEAGRVVIESPDGEMKLSTKRLQPGAEIISDTFGFAIGETEEYKTPIAVSGRVLAYPNEDRYSYPLGCAVCSGPNGTVSQMTREEIREYPERIIGTVSEIPKYEIWEAGNVSVNGRIWIRIK